MMLVFLIEQFGCLLLYTNIYIVVCIESAQKRERGCLHSACRPMLVEPIQHSTREKQAYETIGCLRIRFVAGIRASIY